MLTASTFDSEHKISFRNTSRIARQRSGKYSVILKAWDKKTYYRQHFINIYVDAVNISYADFKGACLNMIRAKSLHSTPKTKKVRLKLRFCFFLYKKKAVWEGIVQTPLRNEPPEANFFEVLPIGQKSLKKGETEAKNLYKSQTPPPTPGGGYVETKW